MTRSIVATPPVHIERRIVLLREHKVLLDTDLVALYGVTTKRFNEQVKRNLERFPPDFMFQLTDEEFSAFRSHFATSNDGNPGRGGRRYLPYAFTEHGAIMAASIINSPRAIEVSVYVVRAFVYLQQLVATHADLAKRLEELEDRMDMMSVQHDSFARNTRVQLKEVVETLREMMTPPEPSKRPIGFVTPEEKPGKNKAKKQ